MLNTLNINIDSAQAKKATLTAVCKTENYDVVTLQETLLPSHRRFKISGYNIFTTPFANGNRGLAILTKTSIPAMKLHNPINCGDNVEVLAVRLTLLNNTLDIYNIYRKITREQTGELQLTQLFAHASNTPTLICGDFNAHHHMLSSCSPTNDAGIHIDYTLEQFQNIALMNNGEPTHIRGGRLDLTFVSTFLRPNSSWKIHPTLMSDHYATCASLNMPQLPPIPPPPPTWNQNMADWHIFQTNIRNWAEQYEPSEDINQLELDLKVAIYTSADLSMPKKSRGNRTYTHKDAWYYCPEVRRLKTIHNRVKKIYRKRPTEENRHLLQTVNSDMQQRFETIRTEKWLQWCAEISQHTKIADIWNHLKKIANCSKPKVPTHPNPQQEAERLAISFADRTSSDNLPISVRLKQQQLEQRRWQEIEHACSLQDDTDIPYTLEELQAAHKKGKDTAPGADNITYTMIANLGTPGELILLKLINKTHTHRTRPSTWNEQDTQPIPKPKDPENPRPIALVSCLEKIAEKMVLNRLKYKTGPLHPQLYAYTDGIGTTECINDVLHCVDGKPANIIFLDFEKAFELASPAAILHSLARKGVKGHLLAWNKNYVKNRKARVRFQGHTSEFKDLENGTPQGGILSPFLFNILMEHIACLRLPNGVYIFIYADDVCAVARGVNKFHNMQTALNMIFETSSEIGLKINIQKTKAMAIRHTNTERNFKIGQQQLEWVNSFMYLGVHIDCELKFNTEIKYLRERANARLSTMKYMTSLKEGASYRVQHAYYLACTRTLIDYAAPTLTNMTQTQKASLEVIQNNAMRLMLGAPMWTRRCNLRAETNLPSLEHRIEQRNISITAKMLGSERDSQTQRRMRDELPKNPDIQRPNTHSKHLGNIMRKCKMEKILLDIKQATHTVNPIPPWENDLANYNYTQLDKPKEQCTLQELKTAAELSISLSENPNCSVFYTDGSVDPTTNTAGAAVYSDTYTASWRTSDTSSTLQTELVAIHKTLQYSINHGHTNVTIHTDSKSALLTLQRTKQKENTHLIYDIKTLLLQHKTAGRKVTLNWIPSHIGIPGNDKADELAGTTKHIDRVQITMPLSILTIKNTLKQTNRTNIEKEVIHWANNNSRSAQWYTEATKFEPPPVYRDTPRHLAVTIHRLRLGYKANWEIVEPIIRPCEHCQTQTEYPLLHYLLQCPNTQSLRPHMQALDPANPEANRIAAGQVKGIMDNIETHIQTLTDFPPPR